MRCSYINNCILNKKYKFDYFQKLLKIFVCVFLVVSYAKAYAIITNDDAFEIDKLRIEHELQILETSNLFLAKVFIENKKSKFTCTGTVYKNILIIPEFCLSDRNYESATLLLDNEIINIDECYSYREENTWHIFDNMYLSLCLLSSELLIEQNSESQVELGVFNDRQTRFSNIAHMYGFGCRWHSGEPSFDNELTIGQGYIYDYDDELKLLHLIGDSPCAGDAGGPVLVEAENDNGNTTAIIGFDCRSHSWRE